MLRKKCDIKSSLLILGLLGTMLLSRSTAQVVVESVDRTLLTAQADVITDHTTGAFDQSIDQDFGVNTVLANQFTTQKSGPFTGLRWTGEGNVRITLYPDGDRGSSAHAYSTMHVVFHVTKSMRFKLSCSASGAPINNNVVKIRNVAVINSDSSSGPTSGTFLGVLVPDQTYYLDAECMGTASATDTRHEASWQFQLEFADDEKALGCGCCLGASVPELPIQIGTGNVFEGELDYSTAGLNKLAFLRYYNSLGNENSTATSLGKKWRSNYDRALRISDTVVAERPDGQELRFKPNGPGWVSDSDVHVQLQQSGLTWVLIDKDGTVEFYEAQGPTARLFDVRQMNGYEQTLAYDASNRLALVADSYGRSLTFTYQTNLLASVTAPNGLVATYAYNSSGQTPGVLDRLASVTYSNGTSTSRSYSYTNAALRFALTGAEDEKGNQYARWAYDSLGRATNSQRAGGVSLFTALYNETNGLRAVITPSFQVVGYQFDLLQNIPKLTSINRLNSSSVPAAGTVRTYDTNGFLASVTDWNTNLTTMVSDRCGFPNVIHEALGTAQERTRLISWHASLPLPLQVTGSNMVSTFLYDADGNQLSRTDTDTTTGSVPYPTTGQTRVWTNTFGSFGQLLTTTGPRTDVIATTVYTYDDSGNISTVTDPLGHVTTITNYTGSGLPTKMVDPNGVTTLLTYGGRDRLLTRAVLATSGNATNTFVYDAVGLLTSLIMPDGSRLNYQYDAAHRLQSVSNSLGESIAYTLDAAGHVTQQNIRNVAGTIVRTQSRVFDTLGRLIRDIGGNLQTNRYQYDSSGNRVAVTDGLNHTTVQAFDPLNRLISSVDPLNNATAYGYDLQDNVTSVSDPRSLVTSYVYDGFGRVIQQTSPDTGTNVYTLDKAGNRISQTDARGVVTLRTFDKLNRVTSETFPASPGENITYTYDSTAGGNFGVGRLTGYADETGATTLTYDERGNLVATTRTIEGTPYTTGYGYDLADHLVRTTYPSGDIVRYTRNSVGRISSVSFHSFNSGVTTILATNVAYLPFGPMASVLYGNGLVRNQAYDQDYRLTNLTTTAAGGTVQRLGYDYDRANNITAITDDLDPARSQAFNYDPDDRLTNATGLYGDVWYSYDADGNRLSRTAGSVTETYSYAPTANRLLSTAQPGVTRNFGYTAAGNMSSDDRGAAPPLTFDYGGRNRYRALSRGGNPVAAYKFNTRGERLVKTVGAVTTHFHYDQERHLVGESQANGAVAREYIWLGDLPLAQVEADGRIYYIHPDHLHTPQKMTDSTRAIVWDRQQEPFGENASLTQPALTPVLTSIFNPNTREYQVTVTGQTNYGFTLQAATNLSGSVWSPLMTGMTPFTFTDSQVPNFASRFYRAASTNPAVTQNLRFPGQYFDAESGLNYNMMRDYDPSLGRYIQIDPLGVLMATSLFEYASSNPGRSVDALGLRPVDVIIWSASLSGPGHVMIVDSSSGVALLSQWPDRAIPWGRNIFQNYQQTMDLEGRPPDYRFTVNVSDDQFDRAMGEEISRDYWAIFPVFGATDCSMAAYRALTAGGIDLPVGSGLLPDLLATALQNYLNPPRIVFPPVYYWRLGTGLLPIN